MTDSSPLPPLIAMRFTVCVGGRQVPCYRTEADALAAGHLAREGSQDLRPARGASDQSSAQSAEDEPA